MNLESQMALTVGTRVRVTLSGEVPIQQSGFGGGNATRNKELIIKNNKCFCKHC